MLIQTLSPLLIILFGTLRRISCQDYCNIPVQDYCEKFADHTMCLPDPDPPCIKEDCEFDEDDIELILDFHNTLRQTVASGNENKAKNGTETLPSASNMCELKWDCELARIAKKLAEQCKFQHDCNDCRAVYDEERFACVGQNIAYQGSSAISEEPIDMLLAAADLWYSTEVGLFDSSVINPFVSDGKYGHYSQLIWAETCYVGCGCSIYFENNFYHYHIVCNYGPCGNFGGEPVYLEGSPCSACSTCSSTYDALCE